MTETACNSYLGVTSSIGYREAAAILWGEAGAYAHDAFARLNAEFFACELPPLPIVLDLTAYGRCVGATREDELPRITLHVTLFNKGGLRKVDDTLLHEMIHAVLMRRGKDASHNSRPWCEMITLLSPRVLGREIVASPVKPRRVKIDGKSKVVRRALPGALTQDELARWPDSLRPADYDYGPTGVCSDVLTRTY